MIDQQIFEDLQAKIDEESAVRDVSSTLGRASSFALETSCAQPNCR